MGSCGEFLSLFILCVVSWGGGVLESFYSLCSVLGCEGRAGLCSRIACLSCLMMLLLLWLVGFWRFCVVLSDNAAVKLMSCVLFILHVMFGVVM